jgi:hypothetical protein
MLYPICRFVENSADLVVGFIDANGTVKITPQFAGAGYFCEGKASVVGADGRSGFLNVRGELAIPMLFQGVSHFQEGVCSINGGYIDHAGRWLIEPRFLIAMGFSEGRTFVSDDGETFFMMDVKGTKIGRDRFERARPPHAGLAPVMKGGSWGFIDGRGAIVIPLIFQDTQAEHFKSGLAGVKSGGRWGFIDHLGDFVIKPYFEEVCPFAEGLASVRLDGKWGMIDLGGQVRVRPKWDRLGQLVNGLASAQLDGKVGFIDASGSWAIEPVYDKAKPFCGELAVVHSGDTPAYIRADGQLVWKFEPYAIVPRPPIPL